MIQISSLLEGNVKLNFSSFYCLIFSLPERLVILRRYPHFHPMLKSEPTPHGAGIVLWGDAFDFSSLYETVHKLAQRDLLGENVMEYVLGLAYDFRKAAQSEMVDSLEKKFESQVLPGEAKYMGTRILWPYLLTQVGILRYAAAYLSTTKEMQANLYRLESCAESALLKFDPETGKQCMCWLSEFSGFYQNYLLEFVNLQVKEFISIADGNERFHSLPKFLLSLHPMSNEYQAFDGEISTSAAQNACSTDDLRDKSDWPDFEW